MRLEFVNGFYCKMFSFFVWVFLLFFVLFLFFVFLLFFCSSSCFVGMYIYIYIYVCVCVCVCVCVLSSSYFLTYNYCNQIHFDGA